MIMLMYTPYCLKATATKKARILKVFKAAQKDYAVMRSLLLENNAIIKEKCYSDATSLFQAAKNYHADVCPALIEHNSNVYKKHHQSHYYRQKNVRSDGCTGLLENNANVNEKKKEFATVQLQVAHQGHIEVCIVIRKQRQCLQEKRC